MGYAAIWFKNPSDTFPARAFVSLFWFAPMCLCLCVVYPIRGTDIAYGASAWTISLPARCSCTICWAS
eukprot:3295429-Rhodomonas_salina.2